MIDDSKVAQVLEFWFGDIQHSAEYYQKQNKFWFQKSDATDNQIRSLFEKDVEGAITGEIDDWLIEPESCLAYIIILDQFTRNIYRGTEKAFGGDRRALRASLLGVDRSFYAQLEPIHRVFLYLPLEHSEDRNCQQESIEAFEKLSKEQTGENRCEEVFASFLEYAIAHKKVIDQFGRFPYRNEILNRESTPEEIEFLKQPGSRF